MIFKGQLAIFVSAIAIIAASTRAEENGAKKDDEELFEFKTPDMTEEEQHSLHLPVHMQCDGCRLISTLLERQFEKKTRGRGIKFILPESDVIEAVEAVCEDKFENYGAKEVYGELRLTGPGTIADNLPGVTSGGGKWPNRLRQFCARYVDEIGDDELYAAWRDAPGNFLKHMCYGTEHPRDACYQSRLHGLKDDPDDREIFEQRMGDHDKERKERVKKISEENQQLRKEQEQLSAHSEL